MAQVDHPAVAAPRGPQPKARPATTRARIAEIWARRLRGPGGTALFFVKRMIQDDILNTAASLCYATALGVVPALAVVLGALSAFPAFDRLRVQVQTVIAANLLPDVGLKIEEALTRFIGAAGKLTALGLLGLAITAILLLLTIEGAFNRIFRVAHPRPLLMRLVVLWAVLTIAPFLLALSATLFGFFSNVTLQDAGLIGFIVLGHIVPTLVTWMVLTFLYDGIPNRPVKMRDAAIGAAVTAGLLEILRLGFAYYVKQSTYGAIYGAVAAVPVFLLWLYAVWIVVMAGAVITAALPDWRLLRAGHGSGPGLKLALALAILDHLVAAFKSGGGLSPEEISVKVAVPPAGVIPVLEELRLAHYADMTEKGAWVLTRNPAEVPFVDLVHRFGLGVGPAVVELRNTPLGERVCRFLEPAAEAEREFLSVCLDELLTADDAAKQNGPDSAGPFRSSHGRGADRRPSGEP